jgi:hypothetical protein
MAAAVAAQFHAIGVKIACILQKNRRAAGRLAVADVERGIALDAVAVGTGSAGDGA